MTVIAHRCAVLGKPIAHSLSPVLHNAAYKALGLDDWAYERHEVGESDLDGFLKGLDPTWCGLSLTMPLKKTIQPYGTPSNMWAQRLKVANTAIFDWPAEPGITPGATPDGASATGSLPAIRLYNTDVMGIVLAFDHELKALGEPDRWKSATSAAVIGNGNTAASAVAACTVMLKNGQTNKRITVAARHPGKNRTSSARATPSHTRRRRSTHRQTPCGTRTSSSARFPATPPTRSPKPSGTTTPSGHVASCSTWSTTPAPAH